MNYNLQYNALDKFVNSTDVFGKNTVSNDVPLKQFN